MKSNRNHSLKEIGDKLLEADSVLLFPHVQMDGDTLGASVALCRALLQAGRESRVVLEEEIPACLRFLDDGSCMQEGDAGKAPDLCVCVDCGELGRLPGREGIFLQGNMTMCIDHHATTRPLMDYNYIDPAAAATAEIVYRLLKEMKLKIDRKTAEALYAGISTDTGSFQYSNTTKETHLIAAKLYGCGIDAPKITEELYQSVSLGKIRLTNAILETMDVFAGGRAAIAYVTRDMLDLFHAPLSEAEGVVETLRNIQGVEMAIFVKEEQKDLIRVSMRAKSRGDVMAIAVQFQGGGHRKAAGCTMRTGLADAVALLKKEAEQSLEE